MEHAAAIVDSSPQTASESGFCDDECRLHLCHIAAVYCDAHDLVMCLRSGEEVRKPLAWLPRLALADEQTRQCIELGEDYICWPLLDEIWHYDGIYELQCCVEDNPLRRMLDGLPQLNLLALAEAVGAEQNQFLNCAFGLATPPPDLVQAVREHLHQLARRCREVAEALRGKGIGDRV